MSSTLPSRFLVLKKSEESDKQELILILTPAVTVNEKVDKYKCKLRHFWSNSFVDVGDFVNIFHARIEVPSNEDDVRKVLIVDNVDGLLVVKPDILISTTTLMSAHFCLRKAWLSRLFEIYGEPIKAFLIGNVVHELFQESLKRNVTTLGAIGTVFYRDILPNVTLDLYSLNMTRKDLIEEMKSYFRSIFNWIQLYTKKSPDSDKKALFIIDRLHEIENSIWSTKYGFIGKLDLSLEVVLNNTSPKTHSLIPLELKTGQHSRSPSHFGQVILYTFIMSDKYPTHKTSDGFLVYLKDESITEHIKTNHHVFRDLIILRNKFVHYYDKLGTLNEKKFEKGENFYIEAPEPVTSLRTCQMCEHQLDCSLIFRCLENSGNSNFTLPEKVLSHLNRDDMEFFSDMISLLEMEKQQAISNDEVVYFWNYRSEDCEMTGMGLSKMEIKHQDKCSVVFTRSVKAVEMLPAKLLTLNSDLEINLSMLVDRRVVISEELTNSRKTYELYGNFCKQLCVNIGQIRSFNGDVTEIEIQLEKEQITFLNQAAVYRIDFLKNISNRASVINFSNTLRLMTSEPRSTELRDIVIRGRIPKNNVNDLKLTSYSSILNSPALQNLNPQQKQCVLGILKTKCSLIFGSPGSGKTQTIVALVQTLVKLGHSVLLTSFTHVAVDNILLKLIQANQEKGENVDFVRLGSTKRINAQIEEFSDHRRTKDWLEKGDLNALEIFYSTVPVVAVTCLGISRHPIFLKRTFDFCILDEASQAYLATTLGPLFSCHSFVLVGDQKQLPPVIQNSYARKNGLEESLFVRLLRKTGKQSINSYGDSCEDSDNLANSKKRDLESLRVFPLFIQYRMNKVIMAVSNQLTYAGKLSCGNLEVEHDTLGRYFSQDNFSGQQNSYMNKALSPDLNDSVVLIDTQGIEQSAEVFTEIIENPDLKNLSNSSGKIGGFVYNNFEAHLIVKLTQRLLEVYGAKGEFKAHDIGIISPFRRQVLHLRELFGSEFLHQHRLEINTVDQYQGRDKDVIIYSCVKSHFQTSDTVDTQCSSLSSLSSQTDIVDSELLKDERRLNVAITRAKKKLIIVGNLKTLARYTPFKQLFDVVDSSHVVPLSSFDYSDIIAQL